MKRLSLFLALLGLLLGSSPAFAQTSPSCAQLPNLACAAGDTYTNTHDFSGATVNLPADAVNAITEIAATLKSGADTTLITGTEGSSGHCAQWNVDGDLVTTGAPCGSGTGDIEAVFNCETGDCASITMAATDLLNMSGVDASTTTEGLILPQHATACAGGTAEGQVCWEADANILHVGATGSLVDFPPASAVSGDITMTGTGASTIADNSVDGTDIAMGSDVTGDITYYNGTDYARLAIGAVGQVLKVSGSNLPSWGNVHTWNEKVCLRADCTALDVPCDCCTGVSAGCEISTYQLSGTPRADCNSFGGFGTILAWSNGIQQKCVASAPGINEFALAGDTITPNSGSSVMYVTYEQ